LAVKYGEIRDAFSGGLFGFLGHQWSFRPVHESWIVSWLSSPVTHYNTNHSLSDLTLPLNRRKKLMISGSRAVFAVLLLAILLVLVEGCGNTFRPTIVPLPGQSGDPASLSQAVILSTNPSPPFIAIPPAIQPPPPPPGPGSVTHIDASGDTNAGVVRVGVNPVFLAKIGTSQALVINGDQTLSLYLALLPLSASVNTVTQPLNSTTGISAAASSNGNIYIANSGANSVTVVPGSTNVAIGNVTVGNSPVSIATNSASNKAYVVNRGDGTVSIINTQDSTVAPGAIPVGTSPIWAVVSTDGKLAFVVNQGGNSVTFIDTIVDPIPPQPPPQSLPTGSSPNFAFYDSKLKRLYVNNSGSNSITVIKADQYDPANGIFPTVLANITLSPGPSPTSLTVLPDGSKAYVARGGCPAGTNHLTLVGALASCTGNLVSVIDAVGLREIRTFTTGPGAVSIDASSDSTKVFVVNSNSNDISVIKTSTDSEVVRIKAPLRDPTCVTDATQTCLFQIPFMVRTFP
jgi:YVTN family beta-propeller protein